jgi:Fe-S-cluster containining protein
MTKEPWYKDGLRFTCTQCGNCCTGAPGVVWVNTEEVHQIAEYIGKSVGATRIEHTRRVGGQVSLKEFANGDCTFFDGEKRCCTIYPVRPRQCRTWPFWNSNLESPEEWESLKEGCPGVGKGAFVPLEEIEIRASVIDI